MQSISLLSRSARVATPTSLLAVLAWGLATPVLLPVTYNGLGAFSLVGAGLGVVAGCAAFDARLRRFAVFLAVFSLGFSVQAEQLIGRIDQQLAPVLEGQIIPVQVVVNSLPVVKDRGGHAFITQFYARVLAAGDCAECSGLVGRKIRLNWYQSETPAEILPGEHWSVSVRLRRPRGTANPNGFDYQAWLLAKGVVATGYVRTDQPFARLAGPSTLNHHYLRFNVNRQLFSDAQGGHEALFRALLIGDKSAISDRQWQVLRATGTVHLMAISGLHIGLVAMLGFTLGGVVSRVTSGLFRVPLYTLAPLLAVLCACGYAALAGFEIPTQRACVMVTLFAAARLLGRQLSIWQVYFFALCTVLALDPFAPLNSGFWLSFAAVAILVLGLSRRVPIPGKVWALIKAQLILLVGMAIPLTLMGLPTAICAPLANLIAVPVVSLVVIPGLFCAVLTTLFDQSLGGKVLAVVNWAFDPVWRYLVWLANDGGLGGWQLPVAGALPVVAVGVGVLAVLCLLAPRGVGLKWVGGALLLVFFFPRAPDHPAFRVTHLDVQQGLAVLVEVGDYRVLYDTGARYSDDFDMGSRVIAPFLHSLAIEHLDRVLISHGDNDHAGGLAGLLATVSTGSILAGQPETLSIMGARPCFAGQHWQVNGAFFEVLWPPAGDTAIRTNNASCVLQIRYRNQVYLLMGDVEASVERQLLDRGGLAAGVALVSVPHHGSKTSSSEALVAHLSPLIAVVSAGHGNRYGHPHPQVVDRYLAAGAQWFGTDRSGAVVVELSRLGALTVYEQRRDHPRPWYGRD